MNKVEGGLRCVYGWGVVMDLFCGGKEMEGEIMNKVSLRLEDERDEFGG